MSDPISQDLVNAKDVGKKVGCWIGWAGLLVGLFPIPIAMTAPIVCGPDANEGNCGVAAAPWLLFFTVPFGIVIGIVGIALWTVFRIKRN